MTQDQIREEVIALEAMGHKRIVIESGEDPLNNPLEYILESIKTIYSIKNKNGEIRRVNVNIAACSVEDYKKLHEAGIGTYTLFQETYNKENYESVTYQQALRATTPTIQRRWTALCKVVLMMLVSVFFTA